MPIVSMPPIHAKIATHIIRPVQHLTTSRKSNEAIMAASAAPTNIR